MTPEVLLSYARVQDLHVAEVASYLQQQHWRSINHPNPRLLVFEKGVDDQGKAIQVVLPSQDDYEDAPYLLTKALNLLSVLQAVSFQEIVDSINSSKKSMP